MLLGDEAAYGAQLEALLSGAGSNECVVAECEQLLKQSQLAQRLAWLVRLYESHGQHKAVLARKRAETPERITKSPHLKRRYVCPGPSVMLILNFHFPEIADRA